MELTASYPTTCVDPAAYFGCGKTGWLFRGERTGRRDSPPPAPPPDRPPNPPAAAGVVGCHMRSAMRRFPWVIALATLFAVVPVPAGQGTTTGREPNRFAAG